VPTTIGAAVIGSGLYGRVHAWAYSQAPGCQLRWVWSRDLAHADAIAAQYGARPTDDWGQIAADPSVDVVSIATPDFAHTEPALAMLKTGKHVLCEKPMALTTDECRQMIAAAERSSVQLMVNFHNRWYPALAEAWRRVHQPGDGLSLGAPLMAYLRLSDRIEVATRWLPWAGQSGPVWFLMPHIADLANWMLGQTPKRVFASGRKGVLAGLGIDCYDVVQAQVVYDGSFATLESSWILPECWPNINEFSLDLHCEHGKLVVTGDQENLVVAGQRYEHPFTLLWLTEDVPIQAFVRCLQAGEPAPVSGNDGLRATAVLQALDRSLASGQVEGVEL